MYCGARLRVCGFVRMTAGRLRKRAFVSVDVCRFVLCVLMCVFECLSSSWCLKLASAPVFLASTLLLLASAPPLTPFVLASLSPQQRQPRGNSRLKRSGSDRQLSEQPGQVHKMCLNMPRHKLTAKVSRGCADTVREKDGSPKQTRTHKHRYRYWDSTDTHTDTTTPPHKVYATRRCINCVKGLTLWTAARHALI